MANNLPKLFSDDEWHDLANEEGDAEVEIWVIRKDKMALLVEREIPHPSKYVTGLLQALLHLPKLCIKKVSVYVDGDAFP